MPTTTNYGWTIPTPGGDTGVWDTILNAAFQEIDDELTRVEILGGGGGDIYISGYDGIIPFVSGVGQWDNGVEYGSINTLNLAYRIPIRGLKVGARITEFASSGAVAGTRTATVALYRVHNAGATLVSAGHAIGGSTVGLTHDVLADNQYFLYVIPAGGNLITDTTAINGVNVTVIETP